MAHVSRSSPDLQGVRLKLSRAQVHLRTLNRLAQRFLTKQVDRVTKEHEPKTKQHVWWLRNPDPVDAQWSVLIGEVAHNLRCVLDYSANLISVFHGADTANPDIQFPIYTDRGRFESGVERRLPSVPGEKRAYIERLQPYNGGEGEEPWATAPVWWLRCINNFDKHRRLTLTMYSIRESAIDLGPLIDAQGEAGDLAPPGAMHLNPAVTRIEGDTPLFRADEHMNVGYQPSFDIRFGEAPAVVIGLPIFDVLEATYAEVAYFAETLLPSLLV